jgi:hypothetical protein
MATGSAIGATADAAVDILFGAPAEATVDAAGARNEDSAIMRQYDCDLTSFGKLSPTTPGHLAHPVKRPPR